MIRLTVEETNLLSIYNEGGKRGLTENINAAGGAGAAEFAQKAIEIYCK